MTAEKNGLEVVTLDENYGYRSKSASDDDDTIEEATPIEEMPVVKIEDWLTSGAPRPTKWIILPSSGETKMQVQAMTMADLKKLRNSAPLKPKGKGKQRRMVKDEDWIQNKMLMENVLQPEITDPKQLDHALAGDITHIVREIMELSGFDMSVISDALE